MGIDSSYYRLLHGNGADPSLRVHAVTACSVLYQKAGFMLVELSFAHELREQRNVVVIVSQKFHSPPTRTLAT